MKITMNAKHDDSIEIECSKLTTREDVDRFVEQVFVVASALWPEILEPYGETEINGAAREVLPNPLSLGALPKN